MIERFKPEQRSLATKEGLVLVNEKGFPIVGASFHFMYTIRNAPKLDANLAALVHRASQENFQ